MSDEKYFTKENNFFKMIKNNISPIDLFIISQLNAGKTLKELPDLVIKEFNIPVMLVAKLPKANS